MVKSSQVRIRECWVPRAKDTSIINDTTATAPSARLPRSRSAPGMSKRTITAARAGMPTTVITTPNQNSTW